jgi:phenylacetate-CoA ligase
MARILAGEQRAGRLHISPEQVFVSSEVLTEETRRLVKQAWGNEPYNQYGASETADIAAEHHRCRRMHLFEDLLFVENVDDNNQPVAPGVYGSRILVTTLFSRTQPLIRYELSDSVRLSPNKCMCDLPFALIDSIQGRIEDTLSLPSVNNGRIDIQPLIFSEVMDFLPVSGWQVIQEADDELTVLLNGGSDSIAVSRLHDQLVQALAKHGAQVPRITIQHVMAIPKSASGKAPLVTIRK